MELGPPSPQWTVPSPKVRGPHPVGRLLTKQTSDSELLTQETSSTEGSPLDLTPQIFKRGQSPSKRFLMDQNNLSTSDSSDEEPALRNEPSSPANTCTPGRRSQTPPTSGSKLVDNGRRSLTPQPSGSRLKDHGSEAFVFEKAVLYRRLKSQESGSKRSSHSASRESSRSGSGYSTPRVNATSLPPGFIGNINDGNDITVEEESYTVRLPVNVLNTVKDGESGKPFTKIGFIEFPSNATLSDIRKQLKKNFAEILQGKSFLFQDAMMADVEPSSEEETKSVYILSVIIRFANEQESTRLFCPCGAPAHFQCSACYNRGYCGRECQLKDWHYHKIVCESELVSSV